MKLIEKPRICSYVIALLTIALLQLYNAIVYVIALLTDMLIVVREMARVFYSPYKS